MAPLRKAVSETSSATTPTTQQSHRLVGKHTVRTSAVRHDLNVGRQGAEFLREAITRDRAGTSDVPGRELSSRSNVDHDDITRRNPLGEFVATQFIELIAFAEIGRGEVIQLGVMSRGHISQGRPKLSDPFRRQSVIDTVLVSSRDDQPCRGERAQMERRVCHALADLTGQFLNVSLPLHQHVHQLRATTVRQRLGHVTEPVKQRFFGFSISHGPTLPIQRTA